MLSTRSDVREGIKDLIELGLKHKESSTRRFLRSVSASADNMPEAIEDLPGVCKSKANRLMAQAMTLGMSRQELVNAAAAAEASHDASDAGWGGYGWSPMYDPYTEWYPQS